MCFVYFCNMNRDFSRVSVDGAGTAITCGGPEGIVPVYFWGSVGGDWITMTMYDYGLDFYQRNISSPWFCVHDWQDYQERLHVLKGGFTND